MKYVPFAAGLFLVVGCSPAETASPTDADATAVEATAIVKNSAAADGRPPEGRYRAVDDSGFVLFEELRADNTYTFSDENGEVLEEGTYLQRTVSQLCFTADTEGAAEKCYLEEIGEDGVWRTTDPDTGVVSIVERVED